MYSLDKPSLATSSASSPTCHRWISAKKPIRMVPSTIMCCYVSLLMSTLYSMLAQARTWTSTKSSSPIMLRIPSTAYLMLLLTSRRRMLTPCTGLENNQSPPINSSRLLSNLNRFPLSLRLFSNPNKPYLLLKFLAL